MAQKEQQRERLLSLFQKVCSIPRQTGDEEGISRFLMEFARVRGLAAERDSHNNVLIRKPSAIPGYRGPVVMVQGHMDMVYEKASGSTHRYEDGIRVVARDGYLMSAGQTSLGADNGLAVAYVLDLLEREDLQLPSLECLITTGEEVGLEGVKNLELTGVESTYLINLDAEEEGVFFTSCAGGVRTDLSLPLEYRTAVEETGITLRLKGLNGGHSGLDIALGRANAIKLLGKILRRVSPMARISYLESPGKANAIASKGVICMHTSKSGKDGLLRQLESLKDDFSREFGEWETVDFEISVEEGAKETAVLTEKTVRAIIQAITFLPYGVISRTRENLEMVQTSSNIGDMTIRGGRLVFLCSSRSSVKHEKEALKEYMQILAETLGMEWEFHGDYPQWEYKRDSRLREICQRVYRRYAGKEAVFTGIHAGIECGYLSEKFGSHIDMISCGANLYDVHTPRERADLESFYRMEEILIQILEEISKESVLFRQGESVG